MDLSARDLMLAGAHFGHRTRFWHPLMAPYIYRVYNNTHIINLDATLTRLVEACEYLERLGKNGGVALFVCAKPYAAELLAAHARRAEMPYINQRWLGGLLTNFKTMRQSVERLQKMDDDFKSGLLRNLTKKEGIKFLTRRDKLEKAIGGVREMRERPDALCLIDAGRHRGAIREANRLGISVVSVVDTNHSPQGVDHVIPGNDDSKQATDLYLREMANAIIRGKAARIDDVKDAVADGEATDDSAVNGENGENGESL